MLNIKGLNKLFNKHEDESYTLPDNEAGKLTLRIDDMIIGYLSCKDGIWKFKYSEAFKVQHEYHALIGFPDLNKVYESKDLWPFFRIRIPGLKQPAIQEIVKKEQLDFTNEYELLKRFGKNTISNPYELV